MSRRSPTEEEIAQFLNKIPKEPKADIGDARKFLYARKFSVNRAVSLWNNHLKLWRDLKMDIVNLETVISTLRSSALVISDKNETKSGCLVVSYRVSNHNPDKISIEALLQCFILVIDDALNNETVQKAGIIVIFDFTSATFANYDYECTEKLLRVLQDHFPARIHKVLIINPVWWVSIMLKAIKFMMKPKLSNKIIFLGNDGFEEHLSADCVPDTISGGQLPINIDGWIANAEKRLVERIEYISRYLSNSNNSSTPKNESQSEEALSILVSRTPSTLLNKTSPIPPTTKTTTKATNTTTKTITPTTTTTTTSSSSSITKENSFQNSVVEGNNSKIINDSSNNSNNNGNNNSINNNSNNDSDNNSNNNDIADIEKNVSSSSMDSFSSSLTSRKRSSQGLGDPNRKRMNENHSIGSNEGDNSNNDNNDNNDNGMEIDLKSDKDTKGENTIADSSTNQNVVEIFSDATDSDDDGSYVDDESYDDISENKKSEDMDVEFGERPQEWHDSSTAIHKSQLKNFIIKLTQESGYMRQFHWICTEEKNRGGNYSTALNQSNKPRNRYINVLPFEETRVVLGRKQNYINANFVRGYKDEVFISCQGPLETTAKDFWRMIWENKVFTIVMATRLVENNRLKCFQYWPALNETKKYGRYEITLTSNIVRNDNSYGQRDFLMKNRETGEVRNILHFQYYSWPDHGVPMSSQRVLDLLETVNKRQTDLAKVDGVYVGPVVVHCSAGIGRTGTFITIDISCKYLKDYGWVDIIRTVNELRTFRAGLVQTVDQYQFCYIATYEYLERLKASSLTQ